MIVYALMQFWNIDMGNVGATYEAASYENLLGFFLSKSIYLLANLYVWGTSRRYKLLMIANYLAKHADSTEFEHIDECRPFELFSS